MKIYEIVLDGFDPSTSDTDNLILWVEAPSIDRVSQCVSNAVEIHEIDMDDKASLDLTIL